MFSDSENFAFIKSTTLALEHELKNIFKDDTDFLVQRLEQSDLNSQILSVSKSKYDGNKFIIWEPCTIKNYSVFYSNYFDGWYTLLYSLVAKYKKEVLIVFLDSIESKGKMGFYYYYGGKERIVRALYDDTKWTFFEKGEMLSFESGEYYKKKKITDRMNNDIMKEYLLKLGININNEDFYKSTTPFLVGKNI